MDTESKTDNDVAFKQIEFNDQISLRGYLIRKQILEIVSMILFLIAVGWAAYNCIIHGETVATLLGAFLGFCFEHWRTKEHIKSEVYYLCSMKKKRAKHYESKLAINGSLDDVLKVAVQQADKKLKKPVKKK
jgi:hypothetical protein